jgi:NADH-quinone oxidoreductase subunit H
LFCQKNNPQNSDKKPCFAGNSASNRKCGRQGLVDPTHLVPYFTIFEASPEAALPICPYESCSAVAQFINQYVINTLLHCMNWVLGTHWEVGSESLVGYLAAAGVHVALLLNVVAVGALVFIWMERKIAGRIQDRLGPTRVGGKFGWLQTLADGLKLITKEDLTPGDADVLLFKLAPYVSFAASFCGYMLLPFASGWSAVGSSVGAFLIIAILGLEVFGVILAGYSSGSKWSLFGAMREAAQVVSYEVPMGMCIVVPILLCGTLDLTAIGNMQAGWFTNWLVFHDPFTFIVFWVYFTCATASVNRAPFDLAEAESELVAGFHTEYSGLRWSFFFMAEYGSMYLVSGLAAVLFFGGWNGPIPIFGQEGLGWAYTAGQTDWTIWGFLANCIGLANMMTKAVVGVTVMMWVRWTFPRLRIDQVLTTCLKYCVPLAAVCFIGALSWQLMELPSLNDLARRPGGKAAVREGWLSKRELPAAPVAPKAEVAHEVSLQSPGGDL